MDERVAPEEVPAVELAVVRWWLTVLSIALIAALPLAIIGVLKASSATDSATQAARHATRLAVAVSGAQQDLAATRAETIRRACEQQNQRHGATIRELDVELRQVSRHLHRAQRRELKASRAFTVLLIDRLAPVQNCTSVVTAATTALR